MHDDHENKAPDATADRAAPSAPTAPPQAAAPQATEQPAKHRKKRRRDLSGIPVEIVQAKERNPANPYSYLTPQERAQRLGKLWHEMFQRVAAETDGNAESP